MIRGANADIAFINKSGVRKNLYIAPGKTRRTVTYADLFEMLPFDDRLYCYEITYAELLDVLMFSTDDGGYSLLTCMTGLDCYYTDDPASGTTGKHAAKIINTLIKDGTTIYQDGKWQDGWDTKKVRIVVSEYLANADKSYTGAVNPLYTYNETDRLISSDQIQRTSVIEALEEEAAENNGLLHVDSQPYYHYR